MNLEATTELEAINSMLQMIGEQPVNNIPVKGFSEASLAQTTLHNVSRIIQNEGLNCNVEHDYVLACDTDGYVVVPSNALNLDFVSTDYVVRGNKVYDKIKHTFVINKPVTCTVTWFLDFSDLPNHVRNYISIKAARKFMLELVGATDVYKLTEQQEYDTMAVFNRNEINNASLNFADNIDVAKILLRQV